MQDLSTELKQGTETSRTKPSEKLYSEQRHSLFSSTTPSKDYGYDSMLICLLYIHFHIDHFYIAGSSQWNHVYRLVIGYSKYAQRGNMIRKTDPLIRQYVGTAYRSSEWFKGRWTSKYPGAAWKWHKDRVEITLKRQWSKNNLQ